jgi:hypothetical protein
VGMQQSELHSAIISTKCTNNQILDKLLYNEIAV